MPNTAGGAGGFLKARGLALMLPGLGGVDFPDGKQHFRPLV